MRDPALTAMLFIECLLIFAVAPSVSIGLPGSHGALEGTLIAVAISQGRLVASVAAIAMFSNIMGTLLSLLAPSATTFALSHIGGLGASLVVTYTVGRAVFAPGAINAHRIRGAIVLYLTLGIIFSESYHLIWDLVPDSLGGVPAGTESWRAAGTILYFSFVTLTSVGFGDIVPIHPLARTLTNLEAILGQLFPATLLARLITLELASRRH